jgi:hypothetical protein
MYEQVVLAPLRDGWFSIIFKQLPFLKVFKSYYIRYVSEDFPMEKHAHRRKRL